MKRLFGKSALPPSATALALLFMAMTAPSAGRAHDHNPAPSAVVASASIDRAAFHDGMRKLWEDHVTWTRLYIVSAAAGLPDARATTERLLRNQVDLGDAIKPFYGEAAGKGLTALLRPHILIAAEVVTAAKAGDSAGVKAASTRWYANSDEIADFLSDANPDNWSRATLRAEMRHHLDLTLQQAQARLRGDWAADIAAYDTVHQHILEMADMLSRGIVSQFPKRFN
ncbi:MAG TPA: hypothetical protein VF017_24005 [Thermoanaerobaculia bacterium]|nr:hypothetical protein [Thermoanaerobaculia bacterium]